MAGEIPQSVLAERLAAAIGGRRVRAALFTTFSFEPDFFEEEVLPLLFPRQAFSNETRVRRAQLEDALREVEDVAVLYDPSALNASGGPARLDVRRLPVRRSTGVFHPKVAALLVEDEPEEEGDAPTRALVLLASSANLTQAGWWENVECAHVEELRPESPSLLRRDLMAALLAWQRAAGVEGEGARAIEAVRDFLRHEVRQARRSAQDGVLHARLWHGQQPLAEFLHDVLKPPFDGYRLEVIAPYLDGNGRALRQLVEALGPKSTRVFLPTAPDGTALCSPEMDQTVRELPRTSWAKLPQAVVARGSSSQKNLAPRVVHAKVYRITSTSDRREYFLVGSPNLTTAAHGKARSGNLEAALLVDRGRVLRPRQWLTPLGDDEQPTEFAETAGELSAPLAVVPPLTIRHLWGRQRTELRWEGSAASGRIRVLDQGRPLASVNALSPDEWTGLSGDESEAVQQVLRATSYLQVSLDGGRPATVLVREEEMAHAPSALHELTPQEILRYWSLLSAEQREAFLESIFARQLEEARVEASGRPLATTESLFDHFPGVFHAFARMQGHVARALGEGLDRVAEYRLLGDKHDSLPVLLAKILADDEEDLALRWVMALSARKLVDHLKREHPAFFEGHPEEADQLERLLERASRLKDDFAFDEPDAREQFLGWFETAFLARARVATVEGSPS